MFILKTIQHSSQKAIRSSIEWSEKRDKRQRRGTVSKNKVPYIPIMMPRKVSWSWSEKKSLSNGSRPQKNSSLNTNDKASFQLDWRHVFKFCSNGSDRFFNVWTEYFMEK